MMKRILWFRRDLRVDDNSILSYEGEVLPIFIFDKEILEPLEKNDRRVSFIYHYVLELKEKLKEFGLDLKIFHDTPKNVFDILLQEFDFDEVVASGDYDSYARQRDIDVSQAVHFRYLGETYLLKPKQVLKQDGTPYLVFTPFFTAVMKQLPQLDLSCKPMSNLSLLPYDYANYPSLQELGFEQQNLTIISPKQKLAFIKEKLRNYKHDRDFMAKDATSHLGVDLRFGTIGVREIFRELYPLDESAEFLRELVFREFYAYLLFHFPHLEWENFKYSFKGEFDKQKYVRFISAQTGVPIVDAGIKQLLTTGDMHNRVRMIVASFFTKDLLLPWQDGEKFFAKHLLDYDAASNILSWQWSAGTGVDPQPYFRVFNPYLQSKKFDPQGVYIKKYLPQLQSIPARYLHDESYLQSTDIKHYPKPIVDHKTAAKAAIEAFKN